MAWGLTESGVHACYDSNLTIASLLVRELATAQEVKNIPLRGKHQISLGKGRRILLIRSLEFLRDGHDAYNNEVGDMTRT
jgi:hypothetical protein